MYHKKLDVWLYPGGHIEKNETPEETLLREVKEETGLEVEIIGEKYHDLANFENDVSVVYNPYVILCELVGDHYHNDIIYLCKILENNNNNNNNNNNIKHNPEESKDLRFFSIDDLDDIKLFPNFRQLLKRVLGEI